MEEMWKDLRRHYENRVDSKKQRFLLWKHEQMECKLRSGPNVKVGFDAFVRTAVALC